MILTVWAVFTVYTVRLLRVAVRTPRPRHRPAVLFPRLTITQVGVATAMILLRRDAIHRFPDRRCPHDVLEFVDLQNDLVVLVESNDEKLSDLAEDGQQIPRFEVERALGADETLYVVEATESGAVRLGAGGVRVDPPPRLPAALFHFRATAASGEAMCTN